MRQQRPVNSPGINVFVALTSTEIFGPYFIEHNINHAAYLDVLQNNLIPDMERFQRGGTHEVIYQQDGAPAHRHNAVIRYLRDSFGDDGLIALNTDFPWPPRSPDMTPLDFYLWGKVKYEVYQHPTPSIEDLKRLIRASIDNIRVSVNYFLSQP